MFKLAVLICTGVTSIPAVALGMFLSGWIMKRFKMSLLGSARLMFFSSVTTLVCTIPYFALSCENIDVAGVTVPYQGYFLFLIIIIISILLHHEKNTLYCPFNLSILPNHLSY